MDTKHSITINQVPIVWDTEAADLSFFGISAVLFWADPSLYRMLSPLVDEVGVDLFRLLVARSSALGTDEDYHAMVTALGATFEEGFLAWGKAVSAAGWGAFELPHFDREGGLALVRINNPWELRMQKASGAGWGCPFLQGKVIGIFGHALGKTCWADEEVHLDADPPYVTFSVYTSERSFDEELAGLRAGRIAQEQARLSEQVEKAAVVLAETRVEMEQKDELIRTLSTPILQVWDGVLVVPLVGDLSSTRADILNAELLERVVSTAAESVVLDLTGLSTVDDAVVDRLGATVSALRLIGTECAVVGLSPMLARAIVELGTSFQGVRVLRTLADALREVVGLTRRGKGRG